MIRHGLNEQAPTLSDSVERMRMLSAFAETIGCATDLSHLGSGLLKTLLQQTRLTTAALWIRGSEAGQYQLVASLGHSDSLVLPSTLPDDHALVASLTHETHLLRTVLNPISPAGSAMSTIQAALCLPLRSKARLLGLCTLGSLNSDICLDEENLAVAEAVTHIASATLNHHLTQDDLRRSSTLMRRTDRLRSLEIMAGGFAHEIRNPLTSIKTFVQLAPQRQHDPIFIREFSQIALEDIHRIEALLHEILDYASYMTPELSDVDLNELVSSCLGFVSSTAAHRGIRLHTALAAQLPLLSLDRQQIKQVLLNLLLNALDAMPKGNGIIDICTRLLPQVDRTLWVQLQVKDQGCGIAPDQLEHIFDPFFTTKHSNSAGDGSGLGLTTAHQIVREHGGTLLVESRVGEGSTFSVNLPAPELRTTVSVARE